MVYGHGWRFGHRYWFMVYLDTENILLIVFDSEPYPSPKPVTIANPYRLNPGKTI
jgi:hypothetical protein